MLWLLLLLLLLLLQNGLSHGKLSICIVAILVGEVVVLEGSGKEVMLPRSLIRCRQRL